MASYQRVRQRKRLATWSSILFILALCKLISVSDATGLILEDEIIDERGLRPYNIPKKPKHQKQAGQPKASKGRGSKDDKKPCTKGDCVVHVQAKGMTSKTMSQKKPKRGMNSNRSSGNTENEMTSGSTESSPESTESSQSAGTTQLGSITASVSRPASDSQSNVQGTLTATDTRNPQRDDISGTLIASVSRPSQNEGEDTSDEPVSTSGTLVATVSRQRMDDVPTTGTGIGAISRSSENENVSRPQRTYGMAESVKMVVDFRNHNNNQEASLSAPEEVEQSGSDLAVERSPAPDEAEETSFNFENGETQQIEEDMTHQDGSLADLEHLQYGTQSSSMRKSNGGLVSSLDEVDAWETGRLYGAFEEDGRTTPSPATVYQTATISDAALIGGTFVHEILLDSNPTIMPTTYPSSSPIVEPTLPPVANPTDVPQAQPTNPPPTSSLPLPPTPRPTPTPTPLPTPIPSPPPPTSPIPVPTESANPPPSPLPTSQVWTLTPTETPTTSPITRTEGESEDVEGLEGTGNVVVSDTVTLKIEGNYDLNADFKDLFSQTVYDSLGLSLERNIGSVQYWLDIAFSMENARRRLQSMSSLCEISVRLATASESREEANEAVLKFFRTMAGVVVIKFNAKARHYPQTAHFYIDRIYDPATVSSEELPSQEQPNASRHDKTSAERESTDEDSIKTLVVATISGSFVFAVLVLALAHNVRRRKFRLTDELRGANQIALGKAPGTLDGSSVSEFSVPTVSILSGSGREHYSPKQINAGKSRQHRHHTASPQTDMHHHEQSNQLTMYQGHDAWDSEYGFADGPDVFLGNIRSRDSEDGSVFTSNSLSELAMGSPLQRRWFWSRRQQRQAAGEQVIMENAEYGGPNAFQEVDVQSGEEAVFLTPVDLT